MKRGERIKKKERKEKVLLACTNIPIAARSGSSRNGIVKHWQLVIDEGQRNSEEGILGWVQEEHRIAPSYCIRSCLIPENMQECEELRAERG